MPCVDQGVSLPSAAGASVLGTEGILDGDSVQCSVFSVQCSVSSAQRQFLRVQLSNVQCSVYITHHMCMQWCSVYKVMSAHIHQHSSHFNVSAM